MNLSIDNITDPKSNSKLQSHWIPALGIVVLELLFTSLALWGSYTGPWWVWLPSQLVLGLCFLHWFILEHDFGHGGFFPYRWTNILMGHVASVFCMIPFWGWKNIHHAHHVWAGWSDKDPTQPSPGFRNAKPWVKNLADFCWRYWIPVFGTTFACMTFWNLQRCNEFSHHDPKKTRQNLISWIFMFSIHGMMWFFFPWFMLKCWLFAHLIFLSISDPLLLSQHTHIPLETSNGQSVKPFSYRNQVNYTRNVLYPWWISRFIILNFDKHSFHHQKPGVPLYRLQHSSSEYPHTIHWLQWLRIAKRMPVSDLILKSSNDTGIVL